MKNIGGVDRSATGRLVAARTRLPL